MVQECTFFCAAAAVEAILGRGKNKEAGAPKTLLATSKSNWMVILPKISGVQK